VCAFAACHGSNKRSVAWFRYCQGSGVAGARQRIHDAPVWPAQEQTRRQSDFPGEIL